MFEVIRAFSAAKFESERDLRYMTRYKKLFNFLEFIDDRKPCTSELSTEFRSFEEEFQKSVGLLEQICSQQSRISH